MAGVLEQTYQVEAGMWEGDLFSRKMPVFFNKPSDTALARIGFLPFCPASTSCVFKKM